MTNSKFKAALTVILVAGAAAILFLQYQTHQKLLTENEALRQQIAQLKSENQEAPVANATPANTEDFNELLRLRGEVNALRAQTNQIARLQAQNQQLQDSVKAATEARQQSTTQADEQRAQEGAFMVLQMNTAKTSVLGMIMYAADNQNQFPTNFDQAAAYFGNSPAATNLNQFEIVYRGSLSNVANPASAIVVRSIQPWMSDGKWTKAYGFADGHAQTHVEASGNFDEWEQQHAAVLKGR
jgi:hypothetical protein